jgi:hypothetical protein
MAQDFYRNDAYPNDAADRHRARMAGSIELRTPELHDFSDLGDMAGPNRLLRWVVAIAVLLTVVHLMPEAPVRVAAVVVAGGPVVR